MPEESHLQASAALAVAERLQDRFWLGGSLSRSLNLSAAKGDWAEARAFGHRGLLVDETDPRVLSVSARLEYETGDANQGAAYLNRLTGPESQPGPRSTLLSNAFAVQIIPMVYRISGTAFRIDYAVAAAKVVIASR